MISLAGDISDSKGKVESNGMIRSIVKRGFAHMKWRIISGSFAINYCNSSTWYDIKQKFIHHHVYGKSGGIIIQHVLHSRLSNRVYHSCEKFLANPGKCILQRGS